METQKRRKPYPTDLKDKKWAEIEHLVPPPKSGGRPAKYKRREILNALFYMTKAGCTWRMLPQRLFRMLQVKPLSIRHATHNMRQNAHHLDSA